MFWSSYECVSVLCDVFLLKGGRGGEEGGVGGVRVSESVKK